MLLICKKRLVALLHQATYVTRCFIMIATTQNAAFQMHMT